MGVVNALAAPTIGASQEVVQGFVSPSKDMEKWQFIVSGIKSLFLGVLGVRVECVW
jgi:hypothetical protein